MIRNPYIVKYDVEQIEIFATCAIYYSVLLSTHIFSCIPYSTADIVDEHMKLLVL